MRLEDKKLILELLIDQNDRKETHQWLQKTLSLLQPEEAPSDEVKAPDAPANDPADEVPSDEPVPEDPADAPDADGSGDQPPEEVEAEENESPADETCEDDENETPADEEEVLPDGLLQEDEEPCLTDEERLETLEIESVRMHNLLMFLRDRLDTLEEEKEPQQVSKQAADSVPPKARKAPAPVPKKPKKTPLPVFDEEPEDWYEVFGEERETRRKQKNRMNGFLVGVALSWVVVALGVFSLLLGWRMLNWSAEILGVSVSILVSLMMLFLLALLLQQKAKNIIQWLLDLLDSDEEDG